MRSLLTAIALLAAGTGIAPAVAQEASAIHSGQILVSADGRPMGKIARVLNDASGAPVAATVIVETRFVKIPTDTLTVGEDNRVTSTLSRAEIRKLK